MRDLISRGVEWFKDQTALFDALWVAVTFHVLLFPVIWFMGWALPWPKSPVITTVITINLEDWMVGKGAKPEKIEELYQMEMTKARTGAHR